MKLTEQEWEERLAEAPTLKDPMAQISALVALYRAVVDGTFPAGPRNDSRQGRLGDACRRMGASFENVAAVARQQMAKEHEWEGEA
jgi:hypothetical protein